MTCVVLAYVYVYHLLKKHDHFLVFGGVRGVGSNTAHSCNGSVGIAGCMYVDILCLSVLVDSVGMATTPGTPCHAPGVE